MPYELLTTHIPSEPTSKPQYVVNYSTTQPQPKFLTNPGSVTPTRNQYDLREFLETEQSPASVQSAGERKASLSEGPRVKSLKVKPEETFAAFENADHPTVPCIVEEAHYPPYDQAQRWV